MDEATAVFEARDVWKVSSGTSVLLLFPLALSVSMT